MKLNQKDFRGYLHAVPFRPFRIHLASGSSLEVPHPDYCFPAKGQVVVDPQISGLSIVPYEGIVRVEYIRQKTKPLHQ